MKRRLLTLAGAGLAATLFAATGCQDANYMAELASRGSTASFDEDGRLERLYTYYPDFEIYRGVYSDTYFWKEGNDWNSGTFLPAGMVLGEREVMIQLPTTRPYQMHEDVIAQHPIAMSHEERLSAITNGLTPQTEQAIYANTLGEY